MSVMPSWPLLGSLSLVLVVLSMSLSAVVAHLRDVLVHRDARGARALVVFLVEVAIFAAVLLLSDFSWTLALAAAGLCAATEHSLLRHQSRIAHGQARMISRTRLRSGARGASDR